LTAYGLHWVQSITVNNRRRHVNAELSQPGVTSEKKPCKAKTVCVYVCDLTVCRICLTVTPMFGVHNDVTRGPAASFLPASKGL